MGETTFGIPADLAGCLVSGLGLATAVESGTYRGESTARLRRLVSTVWSIELSEVHARTAQRRYAADPGIHVLQGDSARLMPQVAAGIAGPALYWLDAHWCGLDSAGVTAQCPLLEEIAAIDGAPGAGESCLLIDDARLFLGGLPEPYRGSDWPSFLEIVDALRARHPRFVTVLLDVIIAGPPKARPLVERFWRERSRQEDERRRRSLAGRLAPLARSVLPERLYRRLRHNVDGRP